MKKEFINVSKQLMFCSIIMIINQYLIKYSIGMTESYWMIAKYLFLVSTWLTIGIIGLLAIVNIVQLISRFNLNYIPDNGIMFPLIASIVNLSGITGLILWI